MFLKQQLCARTGMTLPQIQCGVYQKASHSYLYSSDRKIPDVGPVSVEMCKLQKMGWTLNVQRLDRTKIPILVSRASEVSRNILMNKARVTTNSYSMPTAEYLWQSVHFHKPEGSSLQIYDRVFLHTLMQWKAWRNIGDLYHGNPLDNLAPALPPTHGT